MKKEELQSLGLTPEQIKAVQVIHGKDMTALRKKLEERMDNTAKRQAIIMMMNVLETVESLDKLLLTATSAYYFESKTKQPQVITDTVETPGPEQPEKQDQEVTEQ